MSKKSRIWLEQSNEYLNGKAPFIFMTDDDRKEFEGMPHSIGSVLLTKEQAALFSAAPEMLDALKKMESFLERLDHPDSDILGRICMDAIKQAEGK